MLTVVSAASIRAALNVAEAVAAIEEGFAAYSSGRARVPPVGYLGFEQPPGDCHIKFGHIAGQEDFVIKVATGFYDNPAHGLPSSNGFMVLLSARTGEPRVLLDDGGYLTDVRTALAGLIAAKHLAPVRPRRIGIIGTGVQARAQLEQLLGYYGSCPVQVWGRNSRSAAAVVKEAEVRGCEAAVAATVREICAECDLIVTATASSTPLIEAAWISPGTHITAVGADAKGKQELEPRILANADIRVVDSIEQCVDHGEAAHAVAAQLLGPGDLVELGSIVSGAHPGRTQANQVTVADLTGLAVQDIQIARCVWQQLQRS